MAALRTPSGALTHGHRRLAWLRFSETLRSEKRQSRHRRTRLIVIRNTRTIWPEYRGRAGEHHAPVCRAFPTTSG